MKIIDNRENAIINFEEIKEGECFFDNENDLFIKTELNESYNGEDSNAVSLSDGELAYFDKDTKVQPVQAEIIVR